MGEANSEFVLLKIVGGGLKTSKLGVILVTEL